MEYLSDKFFIRDAVIDDAAMILKIKDDSWLTAHKNPQLGRTLKLLQTRFSDELRFKHNLEKLKQILSENKGYLYKVIEDVANYNTKAISFYKKQGFKIIKQLPKEESYFLTDKIHIPIIRMELEAKERIN